MQSRQAVDERAIVAFEVPGLPVAKGRARVTTIGGHARAYTPPKTARYERLVRDYAMSAMAGLEPFDGPVAVDIQVFVPVPVSWSHKKRASALAGITWPVARPDLDNYLKCVCDGLNGIVLTDDARIVAIQTSKQFAVCPRVEVRVTPK